MFETPDSMPGVRAILGMPEPRTPGKHAAGMPTEQDIEATITRLNERYGANVTYIEDRATHPAIRALLSDRDLVARARDLLKDTATLREELSYIDDRHGSGFAQETAREALALIVELVELFDTGDGAA